VNNNASNQNNRMKAIQDKRPLVISVMSGKGGVGKSTTSYKLAQVLSGHGRVMMADADLLFGNLHIIANVIPQCTIDKFLLADNVIRRPAEVSENVHLLASPSTSGGDLDFDVAGIVENISRLPQVCSDYDYLIVDTPSGVIDVIAAVAAISDIPLVSVMPELTAISDGYGLIKYLKVLGLASPVYLLPNRCSNEEEASYIYTKFTEICKRFLKIRPECLGYIYENHYLTARMRPEEKDGQPRRVATAADDFGKLARSILAIKPKPRKINSFNRPQTINAIRSAADIKG